MQMIEEALVNYANYSQVIATNLPQKYSQKFPKCIQYFQHFFTNFQPSEPRAILLNSKCSYNIVR